MEQCEHCGTMVERLRDGVCGECFPRTISAHPCEGCGQPTHVDGPRCYDCIEKEYGPMPGLRPQRRY